MTRLELPGAFFLFWGDPPNSRTAAVALLATRRFDAIRAGDYHVPMVPRVTGRVRLLLGIVTLLASSQTASAADKERELIAWLEKLQTANGDVLPLSGPHPRISLSRPRA
jgi:hypothetical protein